MKNKKGISPVMWAVIAAILLLVLAGFLLWFMQRGMFGGVGVTMTRAEMKAFTRQCKVEARLAAGEFIDADFGPGEGDGFPDSCDPCLGGNATDQDLDGIPDLCDDDPCSFPEKRKFNMRQICENSYAVKNVKLDGKKVEGKWDDKGNRCVLKGLYGKPHTTKSAPECKIV